MNGGWLLEDWWLLVKCRLRSSDGCAQFVGCMYHQQARPPWRPELGAYESCVCVHCEVVVVCAGVWAIGCL